MERKWVGRWINAGRTMGTPTADVVSAPYLRKTFVCERKPKKASVFLCGLGWHVLYVNGRKADDRVLAPAVTQFDKHVSFIEYDVTKLLKKGANAVIVLLGNGLYNCRVHMWSFDKAPWRDYPKLLCDVVADGKLLARSDTTWKVHDSPVTFNEMRNGQYYDARLETPGFADPLFDDSAWNNASFCMPPGGRVIRETMPPCRVVKSYPALSSRFISCWETTYDFGTNLAGWCRIRVKGKAGARVQIFYSEKIDPISGCIDTREIGPYPDFGKFQMDEYFLKGDPEHEEYEPSFTYHGFRYAMVLILGEASLLDIRAQFVHTEFEEAGRFETSDPMLTVLQRNTLQSFRSNFIGIPTDCPHREKNGWTGDAALAAETGLWNYDMAESYAHFLQIVADTQRPNGQLPGIAPTGGWGFNWGGGPAWDTILFEYPWQTYLFCGRKDLIEQNYDRFLLYLEYCGSRAEDDLLNFGLGDWCHWDRAAITPVEVTSSGYYYQNVLRTAFFAGLLGRKKDETDLRKLAARIRKSFLRKFAHGDGSFADGSPTANAAALYFGFVEDRKRAKTVQVLANQIRKRGHKADFGILGAKYIPRVLAENGFAEDALRIITQKEFPGWGWQVEQGATTLWENWNGRESQNHIMFGDISAWMYQYLGGIRPLAETPGFRRFEIRPCFVTGIDHVKACHRSPFGLIRSEWKRKGGKIRFEFDVPEGSRADIVLPEDFVSCDITRNGKAAAGSARSFGAGSCAIVLRLR